MEAAIQTDNRARLEAVVDRFPRPYFYKMETAEIRVRRQWEKFQKERQPLLWQEFRQLYRPRDYLFLSSTTAGPFPHGGHDG